MKRTAKGLLVAGVPLILGLAFAAGVITAGIHTQGAAESRAVSQAGGSSPSTGAGTSSEEIKNLVMNTCTGCHGSDLKGNVGPSLYEAAQKYKAEEIEAILKNGKSGEKGQMPAGLVKGKEKEVAAFIASLKGH
jgi:cytochrome c551